MYLTQLIGKCKFLPIIFKYTKVSYDFHGWFMLIHIKHPDKNGFLNYKCYILISYGDNDSFFTGGLCGTDGGFRLFIPIGQSFQYGGLRGTRNDSERGP